MFEFLLIIIALFVLGFIACLPMILKAEWDLYRSCWSDVKLADMVSTAKAEYMKDWK